MTALLKILHNPDSEKTYHVWHFCKKCLKTFSHSQGTFDLIANNPSYVCCRDNLEDVSTKTNQVVIPIHS